MISNMMCQFLKSYFYFLIEKIKYILYMKKFELKKIKKNLSIYLHSFSSFKYKS